MMGEKDKKDAAKEPDKVIIPPDTGPASSPSEAADGGDKSGENVPHSPLTTN